MIEAKHPTPIELANQIIKSQAAEIERLKANAALADDVVTRLTASLRAEVERLRGREQITDPAEIRRVFEIDDAECPPPESGFMKL